MPKNTAAVLKRYKRILVPELNGGQLCLLLRGLYLAPAESLSKVQGRPFLVSEIEEKIEAMLTEKGERSATVNDYVEGELIGDFVDDGTKAS